LNNDTGDGAYGAYIIQKPVVALKKSSVEKVMALDARKSESKGIARKFLDELRVDKQFRSGALPNGPSFGSLHLNFGVGAGEACVIGSNQVAVLCRWDSLQVLVPGIRKKERRATLVKPAEIIM
jgi:hypothetical protein